MIIVELDTRKYDLDTSSFVIRGDCKARAVVLNLGSIEPQGFGESVSGVRR